MAKKKTAKKKTGPKAQRLKIEGPWEAAVGKAMKAGKTKAKKSKLRLVRSES